MEIESCTFEEFWELFCKRAALCRTIDEPVLRCLFRIAWPFAKEALRSMMLVLEDYVTLARELREELVATKGGDAREADSGPEESTRSIGQR